jgi:hypothetical protein
MSEELEAAYRATHYRAFLPDGDAVLRIGEGSPDLDRHLSAMGLTTWAFITPYNPRSAMLSDDENAIRMKQFTAEVDAAGHRYFLGSGADPSGEWPPEASLLVCDLSLEQATDLATALEQNAFVFGRFGEVPTLVWCDAIWLEAR